MKTRKTKRSKHKLEGEGSYTATRAYNAKLKQWLDKGKLEPAAEAARRAVEEHGSELLAAERKARSGPPQSTWTRRRTARSGKR
jgi:hypothetical protein